MYIVWGNNIFAPKLTLVQFTRLIEQAPQARTTRAGIASMAIGAQRRRQLKRNFTISRA